MTKDEETDVIGDSLIPVINKLQDIFSQVCVDSKTSDMLRLLM